MTKPRELTEDEVREKFFDLLDSYVDELSRTRHVDKEVLRSMVFHVLVIIDGESANMPGFILAPDPHPDDKDYHKKSGANYYPENHKSKVKCDISGNLHHNFYNRKC